MRDALGENPKNQKFPTVMRLDDHTRDDIEALTTASYSSDYFVESPRTQHEERLTYQQRNQLRLEYPPERAPTQHLLQKRTSELTLSTTPPVQNFTRLQLQADRIQELKIKDRHSDTRKFAILDEAKRMMLAHNEKGEFYKSLSDKNRRDFDEIRRKPATKHHVEWLVDKLKDIDLDYQSKLLQIKFVVATRAEKFDSFNLHTRDKG